jgi:hypothetical protein
MADVGFWSGLLADDSEERVLLVFLFCLGGVNGAEELLGNGELASVLTGIVDCASLGIANAK